jgi:group I intron endonuclease
MQNNCGIYQIRNIVNGNRYIGQTRNLKIRKKEHFCRLRKGNHHNLYLQRSFNKYGENNFVFEIILICDVENLTYYEQLIVDTLNPEYNICKICVKSRLGTGSVKGKIKENRVFKSKYPNPNRGFPLPEETKRKMSKTLAKKFFWNRLKKKFYKITKWFKSNILNKIFSKYISNKNNRNYYYLYKPHTKEINRKISISMMIPKNIVVDIRNYLDMGYKGNKIATIVGVGHSTVTKVKNGYYKEIYGI